MLHLIRGWPGSGKSTYAQWLVFSETVDGPIYEADDYYNIGGQYMWDGTKIKAAHEWCQWRTRMSLPRYPHVIVANTFTRIWEMQPYLDMTDAVKVYRCFGTFQNEHGVPDDMVELMKARMEDYEGETFVTNKDMVE